MRTVTYWLAIDRSNSDCRAKTYVRIYPTRATARAAIARANKPRSNEAALHPRVLRAIHAPAGVRPDLWALLGHGECSSGWHYAQIASSWSDAVALVRRYAREARRPRSYFLVGLTIDKGHPWCTLLLSKRSAARGRQGVRW